MTRSPRYTDSSMSWVTKTRVIPNRCQVRAIGRHQTAEAAMREHIASVVEALYQLAEIGLT